ncbi:WAP four-disulfide core domain protein 2 [Perognathus longimembris pacificus]|uniref:WAP four-disulfide core domain protein 2 n=1 Tax=Perognathus longimembris pacificus TaxID=214514 RepID=UPI0020195085|nr:WAP four-disulfide core domain protein 2 [Perognathus longimembris pacificus]
MPVRAGHLCWLASALLLGVLLLGLPPASGERGGERPSWAQPGMGVASLETGAMTIKTRGPTARISAETRKAPETRPVTTFTPRTEREAPRGKPQSTHAFPGGGDPGRSLAPRARFSRTIGEKSGVCPKLRGDRNCTRECLDDRGCASNRKCCPAGCGALCAVPNEKIGTCPSVKLPQLGICQDQCQEDSQCPDNMKCCRNGCGKVSCLTPDF